MTALATEAAPFWQSFEGTPVYRNGEVIKINPIVDKSLTEQQHLKMFGKKSLLLQGNAFKSQEGDSDTQHDVFKRTTSRSKVTRLDPDAPARKKFDVSGRLVPDGFMRKAKAK